MKTLIAIPIYNEERYVDDVLSQIVATGHDVLAIDDGSTDDTPALLAARGDVSVLTHPENRGYGQSLADAFHYAVRRKYDWVITMDCDLQHEPGLIPAFVEEARRDRADIISGTRYPNGHDAPESAAAPADRRGINRVITEMLNRDLGLGITDAFCGFKNHRVRALAKLRITVPGYAVPLQFWVQAQRAGLHIRELPVPLIYEDANRYFGGQLDDPEVRLAHYLHVYRTAVAESRLNQASTPVSAGASRFTRACPAPSIHGCLAKS